MRKYVIKNKLLTKNKSLIKYYTFSSYFIVWTLLFFLSLYSWTLNSENVHTRHYFLEI